MVIPYLRRSRLHGAQHYCYWHRRLSSTTSSNNTPENVATIISGPSYLSNTGVHRPSPSLFLLPGLRSLPFWTAPPPPKDKEKSSTAGRISVAYGDPTVTSVVETLESNYSVIKEEYMSAVLGIGPSKSDTVDPGKLLEQDYDVNKKGSEHASDKLHKGTWDWHSYCKQGTIDENFKQACPKTTKLLEDMDDHLFFGRQFQNPFAFSFFSTLHGKSYIQPHTGPMNLRLRVHLPLIVPSDTKPDAFSNKPQTKCGLRVGNQIRSWEEGRAIVFDDSYEHEVWNETKDIRVILLLDLWHPDVRMEERERIGGMFDFAKEQGWMTE